MKTNADIAVLPRSVVGAPRSCVSVLRGASMKGSGEIYLRAFEAKMSGKDELRLVINGEIGVHVTSGEIEKAVVEAMPVKTIRVLLNSIGGNAYEGIKIKHVLDRAQREGAEVIVEVDTVCMSAATVVTCSGTVLTHSDSTWMYHNPSLAEASGESSDLRALADDLDLLTEKVLNLYTARNPNMTRDEIAETMAATTYLTGDEAVTLGWADGLLDGPASQAVMSLSSIKPATLTNASKVIQARLKALKVAKAKLEGDEDEEAKKKAEEEAALKAKMAEDDDKTADMSAMLATMTDTIEALSTQVAGIAEAIEEIVGAVETVAEETGVDIEVDPATIEAAVTDVPVDEEPAADMADRQVVAMAKLAKAADREDEFNLLVEAGVGKSVLRAKFIGGGDVSITSAGLNGGGKGGTRGKPTPKMASPSSIFAARRAAKAKKA